MKLGVFVDQRSRYNNLDNIFDNVIFNDFLPCGFTDTFRLWIVLG